MRPPFAALEAAWFLVDNSQLQAKSFGAEPPELKGETLEEVVVSKGSTLFFGEDFHFDTYCFNVLETTIFFTWSFGVQVEHFIVQVPRVL